MYTKKHNIVKCDKIPRIQLIIYKTFKRTGGQRSKSEGIPNCQIGH